tara:strand:+ start:230 stop:601 length:372 start_codon:yes stop_codon:yes gene_type:complete
VEPYDIKILNECKKTIIDKGGYIFFGKKKNKIIGTFAFIKKNKNSYELSKMAIKKEERGKGYGSKMLEFAILFGKNNNWNETYLYSNTKLKNSIYLYKKYGFKKTEIGNSPYLRGNIRMAFKY